ncbi:MAG: hypothetical protein AAGC60_30215 [Acidobacteriota bacterium]
MSSGLHLFLELTTLLFFLVVVAHALVLRGRDGAWLMGSMLALGFVRENCVALYHWLYRFADLHLHLGAAPLITAIIWGYSIYIAICWAESVCGEAVCGDSLETRRASPRLLAALGVFMIALVGFYEPFLELVDMAKWQDGTRRTLGVPWIALVGYPTLSVPFVAGWCHIMRRHRGRARLAWMTVFVVTLAFGHAWGLQWLKGVLGW